MQVVFEPLSFLLQKQVVVVVVVQICGKRGTQKWFAARATQAFSTYLHLPQPVLG
jgi:hypothetical protein